MDNSVTFYADEFEALLIAIHQSAKGNQAIETVKTYDVDDAGTEKLVRVKEISRTIPPNRKCQEIIDHNPIIKAYLQDLQAAGKLE